VINSKKYSWQCDHITPICRGGTFDLNNVTIACVHCNQVKGRLLGYEFGDLLFWLSNLPPAARADVCSRLRRGAKF